MQRIMVDLPEPDGPHDDDALAAPHRQVDVAQHVELAVPFVHADDLDGERRSAAGVGGGSVCVERFVVAMEVTSCGRCRAGAPSRANSATCRSSR